MERRTRLPKFPERPADAHKGRFGKVLIVAGSRGMSGAAVLAGLGALRGGAGLVYVASPLEIQAVVAGFEPSYLTIGLPDNKRGQLGNGADSLIQNYAADKDVVAIGPGLGESKSVDSTVSKLYRTLTQPLVVDADGLNALARRTSRLTEHAGPRILTPHPGEFARLVGCPIDEVHARREEMAFSFAAAHGVTLLLKGPETIVTDGEQVAINATGNSGMATGGTGDVLTGLIAALLAQGMAPLDAAQLAAWMHGRAADLAAGEVSQPGLVASDIPRYLGDVWLELSRSQAE